MSREIMQQALSAFEEIMFTKNVGSSHIIAKNARYALREELAKPEQEPVCYLWVNPETLFYEVDHCNHPLNELIPVYTSPPRKEWVDLTDDEIENVRHKTFFAFREAIATNGAGAVLPADFGKNLIAAFKEKNSSTHSADSAESFCEQELHNLMSVAERMALELECLLLDTKDLSVVSQWWNTGMESLQAYRDYIWSITHGKDGEHFCDPHCVHTDHHPDCELAQPEQEPVALKQLRDLHKVQGSKGCYDVNECMCGLYNGLELALSLFENRDPAYKETQPIQVALDKKADNARELGLNYDHGFDRTASHMAGEYVDTAQLVAWNDDTGQMPLNTYCKALVNWQSYSTDGDSMEQGENVEVIVVKYQRNKNEESFVFLHTGNNQYLYTGVTVLKWKPLYTEPPKREFVGLTDEERVQVFVDAGLELAYMDYDADMKISKVIEAKLKEKNT